MNDTGIVILAAGSSTRLGRPKQLLQFQNKSLAEHIIDEAVKAKLYPIVVVTGANAETISLPLKNKPVVIVHNDNWESGMGSGIKAGLLRAAVLNEKLQSIIIAVCDQPFVSASLFEKLMERKLETGKGMIACAYANTMGTPVLFGKMYFGHLKALEESEGAKGLLKNYKDDVATVYFPQGSIDIDTEEDYKNLISLSK
jgi:molybdenum cofactor cytidylyltransferase